MADNALKTPTVQSLIEFSQGISGNSIQTLGKALPCSVVSVSGAIVTVKFEVQSGFTLPNVTVPLFGPEYVRYPIQPGDKGFVVPGDAYLGGMSGLGGGVADLAQRGNLTSLVFFPIGNKNWTAVDPQAVTVYGPNGAVLRDTGSNCVFTLTPNGITIKLPPGQHVAIDGNGGSIVVTNGDVIADGISLKTHVHGGVEPGSGDTGPPVG